MPPNGNANSAASPAANSMDPWAAQLRRGCLELAILASLWGGPRYGLEIIRALRDNAAIPIAEGTLYPILNRLKSDGAVDSEWRDAGSGHPRKYYSLTPAGRQRTESMAAAWVEFSSQMNSILTSLKGTNHD